MSIKLISIRLFPDQSTARAASVCSYNISYYNIRFVVATAHDEHIRPILRNVITHHNRVGY